MNVTLIPMSTYVDQDAAAGWTADELAHREYLSNRIQDATAKSNRASRERWNLTGAAKAAKTREARREFARREELLDELSAYSAHVRARLAG